MPKQLKQTLKTLYLENGLFAFLFFFIPLIPGYIENRTHGYLRLIESLMGVPESDIEPAVKTIFGDRGVRSLHQYRRGKVTPVLPSQIETEFITNHNPKNGFRLLDELFINPQQRRFVLSDQYRTKAINLSPSVFHAYPGDNNQIVRSLYIQKIAALAQVEKAIDPLHAILVQFTRLLQITANTERLVLEKKAKLEMNLLAARIKAELVGTATAGDPQFSFYTEDPIQIDHLITQEDLNLMVSTLHLLKEAQTPEISLAAHNHIRRMAPLPSTLTS